MHTGLTASDKQIALIKSLSWLLLGLLVFVAAIVGFFHPAVILAVYAAIGTFLLRRFFKHGESFRYSKEALCVSLILLIGVSIISSFTTPTIFSGRDQGTISEAAIRLAQNHQFSFSTPATQTFFSLYGPGKALNFPGFYYNQDGSLIAQFPLAYISWLAFFYSLFGLVGITIANAVLLYFFTFSFYSLCRYYLSRAFASLALAFIFSSFIFGWFTKFTLSENMALALVWTLIFSLVHFLKKPTGLSYATFAVSAMLLVFTRIEGVAILLTSSLLIFYTKPARAYLKKDTSRLIAVPLIIFSIIFAINTFIDINFYREIVKALLNSLIGRESGIDLLEKANAIPPLYNLRIFILYGIMGFLVLGAIATIKLLRTKNYASLIPLFIVAPTLVYLIDSHISLDQPWMLRRYLFSIVPVALIYSVILLSQWWMTAHGKSQKILLRSAVLAIIFLLFACNLNASARFFTYSENRGLLEQSKQLSASFSANDLVLLDRNVTGDGWAMISGPMSFLWGKNAVYFFNAGDLDKIDYSAYEQVYLVVPNASSQLNTATITNHDLVYYRPYHLHAERLDALHATTPNSVNFPSKVSKDITGSIYIIKK